MTNQGNRYDVIIAGQGAAGFAAALYAARYQMRTVVIGETFGGETATGGLIENYPGYTEIDGFDLMTNFRKQVEGYEVPIVDDKVVSVRRDGDHFVAATELGDTYESATIIIAVGRERRKLGLEHEEEWVGRGVSYCSTCDAPLHRGNVVGVVGGGDAAVKGAVLLNKYARKVYLIYRGASLTRPEPANLRQLAEAQNVESVFNTNVVELTGKDGVEGVVLDKPLDGSTELELNGIFMELGADPRVDLANQLGVQLDERDEIVVDKHMRTNVHGCSRPVT